MEDLEWLEKEEDAGALRRKKRIGIKGILIIAGIILILLVTVVVLAKIIKDQKDKIREMTNNPMIVSPIAPEIVLDTIHDEMGEISELATEEYLFTNAARFSDSKQIGKWNIPGTQKAFVLKWDGKIKAGVDLEKVSFEVKKDTIVVTVPKAKILSYETDNDTVEVLDEKNNVFNPITVTDKVDFDEKTEDAMKERAIENGLLEKAQVSAEDIITRLLTANSQLKEYAIVFVVAN